MARCFLDDAKRIISDHVATIMRITLNIYDRGEETDILKIFNAVRDFIEKRGTEMLGTKCATCEHISLKIFFDEELQDYQYIVTCKVNGPLYAEGKCEKYDVRKESLIKEEI